MNEKKACIQTEQTSETLGRHAGLHPEDYQREQILLSHGVCY